jgi:hypothetical protein
MDLLGQDTAKGPHYRYALYSERRYVFKNDSQGLVRAGHRNTSVIALPLV